MIRVFCIAVLIAAIFFFIVGDKGFAQSKGGRWQFENDGLDTAGWDLEDNNGLLFGSATFSNAPPLQQQNFYLWQDSANVHDFFLVDDSDDLDFTDENVGISAWIFPVVLERVHNLVNKGNQFTSPKTTNYSLRISGSRKLEFLIRDANNQAQRVTSSFNIPVDTWSFVAAFYDFTEKKVYMWNDPSASAIDTLDFDQNIFANSDPLAIGSWFRSDSLAPSTTDFEGRLDDVRISGRVEDIIPDVTTSIASGLSPLPQEFVLFENYPNPFNPSTKIAFRLKRRMEVSLKVYNLVGQLLYNLLPETLEPGDYERTLDASGWPSGYYVYQLTAGGSQASQTMLLVK